MTTRQEKAARLVRTLISLLQDLESLFLTPDITEEATHDRACKRLKTSHTNTVLPPPSPKNPVQKCTPLPVSNQTIKQSSEDHDNTEEKLPGGGINEVHLKLMTTANKLIENQVKLNRENLKEEGFRITLFKHYPELTQLFREMKKKYNPQLKARQRERMTKELDGTSRLPNKQKNPIRTACMAAKPPESMLPAAEKPRVVYPETTISQKQPKTVQIETKFEMDSTGLIFTLPDDLML